MQYEGSCTWSSTCSSCALPMCLLPMCPIPQGPLSLSAVLIKIPLYPCGPLPMCPIRHVSKSLKYVKLSKRYQNDVKLSKKCQKVKDMDYGGGSHKKWIDIMRLHTYWCQFWHQIWWCPKTLKMCIESVFEQFWWSSYLTSKLMSICVSLIMPIYSFCEPPP